MNGAEGWFVKFACEWGLGFNGETWMGIGLKFDQRNLMGLVFDPWIPSNEPWCCNVGIQELRSNGAQSLRLTTPPWNARELFKPCHLNVFFFVFFLCALCIQHWTNELSRLVLQELKFELVQNLNLELCVWFYHSKICVWFCHFGICVWCCHILC